MADPLLVALLGPTASGKTTLSLILAERFGGEILSCDSVAVYREFEIGTAKPSQEERRRVPHHLLDIVSPNEVMTAGDYARRARQVVEDLKHCAKLPLVVGGTGFYLRALLDGLFAGPQRSEELRERLRAIAAARGSAYLHRMLTRFDRGAAERIHPNDLPKIVRALEICFLARQPMTELWGEGREPLRGFTILRIGLDPDRQLLYERINRRALRMFEAGLVEETQRLMWKYPNSPVLNSLGYKQAGQVLRGELNREVALASVAQAHRNYAKRQMTWFRRELEVQWLRGFGDDPAIAEEAIKLVESESGELN
ncbi:MAG TPA: tRNA (adenosine(37)-N6)-dimethylallyltransferase MiaA [Terriglobales bacterium]|nr:tRNA (adenosine(37)-N6)-dimethylallyltransferase MiaA [Terriglobales bacterium]